MRLRSNHNAKKQKMPIHAIGKRKNARYLDGDPFATLSISVPAEMKLLIVQRAVQLHLTVSQYIRQLVNDEINVEELKV